MAIHPRYAEAIMNGRKKVEFRKRSLAPDIDTVIIYATAPEKAIVGEFSVGESLVASPEEVWSSLGKVGCIEREAFDAYFARAELGVALKVRNPRRYRQSVPLAAIVPEPAIPQSFTYISEKTAEQVRALGTGSEPVLDRIAAVLSHLVHLRSRNSGVLKFPEPFRVSPKQKVAAKG